MAYWSGRSGQLAIGWMLLAIVVVLLAGFRATQLVDLQLLDVQFRILRSARSIEPVHEVALVGIDEKTLAAFPEPIALWHKHFADVLLALMQVQPAVVGLDIVLPDRSYDRIAPGYDKMLIRGIVEARRAFPLVLALTIDPEGKPRQIHRPTPA